MNTRQLSVLFVSTLLLANTGHGLITPIVSGLNVFLPIIGASSTAGIGTILAALGALKLGAAALFLVTQQELSDEVAAPLEDYDTGYGAPEVAPQEDTYGAPEPQVDTYGAPQAPQLDTYGAPALVRQRRSAQIGEATNILALVESLDKSNCAKQLVCQIHAKSMEARTAEEALIISLFSKQPGVAASKIPLAEFEIAAKIGATTGSGVVCQEAYNTCPYTATQIMTLFKSL